MTSKYPLRLSWLCAILGVAAVLPLGGCQSEQGRPEYLLSDSDQGDTVILGRDRCATPQEGCDCNTDGEAVNCGRTTETFDDYVTCSEGKRTCTDGKWGTCSSDRLVQRPLPANGNDGGPGLSTAALGPAVVCPPGFDQCDPGCHQAVDSAGGFPVGTGLINSATALKLAGMPRIGCTSLSISASSPKVTVTQISPLVAPAVTLSAVLTPPCVASPFATTWTIDRFDIGSISGSNSANGVFTVGNPIVGNVKVTAYALGLSATTTIQVIVRATQDTNLAPNLAATTAQLATLKGTTTPTTSSVTWLYPYENTFFPLGLPAPVVQYRASTSSGGAVKLSLRYPRGSTLSASTFDYSLFVKESNTVSVSAGMTADTAKPQIQIPQVAWQAFEQTARGNDADLIVQRVRSDGTTLEAESPRTIRLVNGQLKGTVFYNSYSSQLSGSNTGAVLKIAPGATTPTLAVQPNGQCTVCHSVNNDGTRLIAGGGDETPQNAITFNKSRRFDVSQLGPAPPVLNYYNAPNSTDVENIPGNKFTYGGPRTDGSLYMTHAGNSLGDKNWRSPPDYSRLYDPAAPANPITVGGWTNVAAVTPRFSSDGSKLAFGFWGGSNLAQSPTGTLAADTDGSSLVVVDFIGSSNSWNVSNARVLTPGVSHKVGWPAFTPNGDAVVYQRQYRSAKAAFAWSASEINTVAGALGELWMSAVPADKNTTVVPTQLRALNGLNPTGTTSYLPTTLPATAPKVSYHLTNGSFSINQADSCGVTATVSNVNDYQLNYLPAMAPAPTGGYNWVIFTSRRMYGSVADDDPWDAEPGPNGCGSNKPCTCTSGVPPAKKLWVAAIDTNFTPGTDPSHAAFYLPGQELKAGNSDGYWVNAQCIAVGAACSSNDDCCGGTGANPTARCDATTDKCQAINICRSPGQACGATSECCSGLVCTGTGTCANPEFFNSTTYQREYVADCPAGTRPVWRLFEWQSTIPAGSSIDIKLQTKQKATDAYLPTIALASGQINQTTPAGIWGHGLETANQSLVKAGYASQKYLLVSLTLNPDVDGQVTPSLSSWRQNYSCEDSE